MSNNDRKKFVDGLKIASGIAAGAIALSGLAACGDRENIDDVNTNQPSSKPAYSANKTEKEELESLVRKAEQDFLKRYLEAYNKQYNTDYMAYETELVTNSISDGVVFSVNGKLVTTGGNYTLVKEKLSKYGEVTTEDGHDKVMQILIDRDGKTILLGTYDSKTLEAMYSGTQIDSFEQELTELEDLGISKELAEAIAKLSAAKGGESKESIEQRVGKYNETVKFIEQGFEIE